MANMHKYTKDPKLLTKGIESYLDKCIAEKKCPHMVGLATHLKIHRQRLSDWITTFSGDKWKDTPQAAIPDTLKIAKQACECGLLDNVINGSRPVGSMFVLKTNYGYIESQHVKHEHSGGVTINIASAIPGPLGKA